MGVLQLQRACFGSLSSLHHLSSYCLVFLTIRAYLRTQRPHVVVFDARKCVDFVQSGAKSRRCGIFAEISFETAPAFYPIHSSRCVVCRLLHLFVRGPSIGTHRRRWARYLVRGRYEEPELRYARASGSCACCLLSNQNTGLPPHSVVHSNILLRTTRDRKTKDMVGSTPICLNIFCFSPFRHARPLPLFRSIISRFHWRWRNQHFFYYETSTGRTTWDPPDYPAKTPGVPRTPRKRSEDTRLEGVVLDQRKSGAHPRNKEDAQCQEASLLEGAYEHQPNRRQRGESKDRNRIHTWDASLKKKLVDDGEPQKDYISFAKEYSMTAPFREISGKQACVICQKRKASGVFFPCEHKCACQRCIERQGFGNTATDKEGGSLCPVCCQQVVFVAPCKGGKKEVELYWRWVLEVKPPLPRDFQRKFHMAAILLKIKTEPDSHKTWDRPSTQCCVLS